METISLQPARSGRSRFDRVVIATLLALLFLVALLLWGGDRAGLRVTRLQPAPGATGVSGGTPIALSFTDSVAEESTPALSLSPPISGTTRWEGNALVFYPASPLQPETTYTVELEAGLISRQGRALKEPVAWSFTTRPERIVYIGWDAAGIDQIFLTDRQGEGVRQLTTEPHGLIDYAASTDGQRLVYAALRADGGSDLWTMALPDGEPEQLLDCGTAIPRASCNAPVWLPHSERFIYERRNFLEEGAPPGPPRLYWFDLETGGMAPVYDDSQQLGLGARFSADGRWLSYVAPNDGGVQIVNLRNGDSIFFPTQTGQAAPWNPAANSVLLTDMQLRENGFAMHLFRLDVPQGETTNLSGNLDIEDGPATWSPDGSQIALGRKPPRTPTGKQIWLMAPDGGNAVKVTADAAVHHGAVSWSATGTALVFQRYAIDRPAALPGVWTLDLSTGVTQEIAAEGLQPSWLP